MALPRILVLVLAGGAGGRLELLTEQRAKPAVPFGGVYRLIDFPLSNCQHSSIADVWVPFVFHFDFVDTATGRTVLVSERRKAVRDRYTVTVPDPRLDFRVAASMAVALDALQSR